MNTIAGVNVQLFTNITCIHVYTKLVISDIYTLHTTLLTYTMTDLKQTY